MSSPNAAEQHCGKAACVLTLALNAGANAPVLIVATVALSTIMCAEHFAARFMRDHFQRRTERPSLENVSALALINYN